MSFDWNCEASVRHINMRFDYAWKWFEYHASQRLAFFRLSLVLTGILLSALAFSAEHDLREVALGICVFGFITSLVFLGFDTRNAAMVEWGEDILRGIEDEALFPASEFAQDGSAQKENKRRIPKTGECNRVPRGIFKREIEGKKYAINHTSIRRRIEPWNHHRVLIQFFISVVMIAWLVAFLFLFGRDGVVPERSEEPDEPTIVIETIEDSP